MASTPVKGTSSTAAIAAISSIAQGLISNYTARGMEADRKAAAEVGAKQTNKLRASGNAAIGAVSTLQRYLQSQRTQRAVKNSEALFAQGQEAITGFARARTETDFKGQIASAQEAGASAARSAANGVAGDSLPVEQAQLLATARSRAAIREQAELQQDDLSIKSSRALAGGATGGDLSVLLPGLDRRFASAGRGKWLPNTWETLLGGVAALPEGQFTNLIQTATPAAAAGWNMLTPGAAAAQPTGQLDTRAYDRFIAPDGMEDQ